MPRRVRRRSRAAIATAVAAAVAGAAAVVGASHLASCWIEAPGLARALLVPGAVRPPLYAVCPNAQVVAQVEFPPRAGCLIRRMPRLPDSLSERGGVA